MVPSNSNLNKENCSSTSSNCVVWQGRDIPCLNLCNGDSVSDVIYKLAEEVCTLLDNIGLDAVELDVLVTKCKNTAEPAKTLTNVLNLIIDRVICVADALEELPPIPDAYEEPELTYPTCDIFAGDDSALLSTFVSNLAIKICQIGDDINGINEDIDSLKGRVTTLEENQYELPTPLSCITNTSVPLDELVTTLENAFCDLSDKIGTPEEVITAFGQQCENLDDQMQLMKPALPMSNISGWTSNGNLAESINNLWLTVCDIRGALKSVLENCCAATCDDILIDFYQKWDAEAPILYLNFKAKSKFINGFYDCGQTPGGSGASENSIVFTDIDGMSLSVPVKFRDADYPTDLTGYLDVTADLGWIEFNSLASLNLSYPLTATAELCFTNGTTECVKCYTWTINKYVGGCCEVTATGAVTIKYKVCDAPQVVASPYPSTGDNAVVIPAGLPQNIIVPSLPSGIDPGPTTTCNAPEVTVNLTAGQVFVIPKGAIVTYVSDITKLENSQCIPNIGDVPTGTTTSGGGGGNGDGQGAITLSEEGVIECVIGIVSSSLALPYEEDEPHGGISGSVCVNISNPTCNGEFAKIAIMVLVNGVVTYPETVVFNGFLPPSQFTRCVPVNAQPSDNVEIRVIYNDGQGTGSAINNPINLNLTTSTTTSF